MITFKEFFGADPEQEKLVEKLAIQMGQQLKASQTPITTMSLRYGNAPINAYVVRQDEVSKRLGLMEKKYIPWLMQFGILVNDPTGIGPYHGYWVIDSDRLNAKIRITTNPLEKIANNKLYQFSKSIADKTFDQFTRSNPQTRTL